MTKKDILLIALIMGLLYLMTTIEEKQTKSRSKSKKKEDGLAIIHIP